MNTGGSYIVFLRLTAFCSQAHFNDKMTSTLRTFIYIILIVGKVYVESLAAGTAF